MNPERFVLAREFHGLTQGDLAERIKASTGRAVAQSSIAEIETNRWVPSLDLVEAIASVTGFSVEFFEQGDPPEFPVGSLVLYRAKSVMSAKDAARVRRHGQLIAEMAFNLERRVNPLPVRIPDLGGVPPVEAAQITRGAFGLSPDRPIPDIIRTIERAGVYVFALPIARDPIDAFSVWVGLQPRPCIGVLADAPADRMRFSVSHELGHLILHRTMRGTPAAVEDEADLFASEFLTPRAAMEAELVAPVTLSDLHELKARWRVSMRVLVNRAYEVRAITPRQRTYLFKKMNMEFGGKNEPTLFLPEQPRGLRQLLEMVYGLPLDLDRVAADFKLPKPMLQSVLANYVGGEKPNAKIVPFRKRSSGGAHPATLITPPS